MVNYLLSKIEAYENIATGATPQVANTMTPQRAAELVEKYRARIKTDFSKDIKNVVDIYNNWAIRYDKASNGLASRVMGIELQGISAKAIGIS